MTVYADSSVLCSIYGGDANSGRADIWRQIQPFPLPFTPLHRLEVRNAAWLAVFRKQISPHDAQTMWQEVETDFSLGVLVEMTMPFPDVWQDGESLIEPHTGIVGSRSLDILHLAFARAIGATEFATFDKRQAVLAARLGFHLAQL